MPSKERGGAILQMATAKQLSAESFLTADSVLHEMAQKESLHSIYVA